MNAIDRALNGLVTFQLTRFEDSRGFFEEFYNATKYERAAPTKNFVQVNHSRSKPNVLRGLHYQIDPPQGKLVGVIRGTIWDVAVDVRKDSPTRGRHYAVELSEQNGKMLWIPAGFAHGFLVLGTEPADVLYMVDNVYNPKTEAGIVWNDPTLAIPWPIEAPPTVSEKDQAQPLFK